MKFKMWVWKVKILNLLTGLSEKKGIIVNVVDVFDFEGSFINAIQRIVGNKNYISGK